MSPSPLRERSAANAKLARPTVRATVFQHRRATAVPDHLTGDAIPLAESRPGLLWSHPLHELQEWLRDTREFNALFGNDVAVRALEQVELRLQRALQEAADTEPTISARDAATLLGKTEQAVTADCRAYGDAMGAQKRPGVKGWVIDRAKFQSWARQRGCGA